MKPWSFCHAGQAFADTRGRQEIVDSAFGRQTGHAHDSIHRKANHRICQPCRHASNRQFQSINGNIRQVIDHCRACGTVASILHGARNQAGRLERPLAHVPLGRQGPCLQNPVGRQPPGMLFKIVSGKPTFYGTCSGDEETGIKLWTLHAHRPGQERNSSLMEHRVPRCRRPQAEIPGRP